MRTQPSSYDTLLGLYTGTSVTNLIEIASNDDATNTATYSALTQAVISGQVYRIAVDGYGGSFGTNSLNYQFTSSAVVQVTVNTVGGGTVSPGSGYYPSGGAASPRPRRRLGIRLVRSGRFDGQSSGVDSVMTPPTVI